MTTRKQLRDAARTALQADAAFADVSFPKTQAHNLSEDQLPVCIVTTRKVRGQYHDKENIREQVDLAIVFRMIGGDTLEDDLDVISDLIRDLVHTSLRTADLTFDVGPPEQEFNYEGDGKKRAGAALVTFPCFTFRSIPGA